MKLERRRFLWQAGAAMAAAWCAPRAVRAEGSEVIRATLTLDRAKKLARLPADYTGLSYESAQLANPAFFARENRELVRLFGELGARGVLRIGGSSSEFTAFTTKEVSGPPMLETANPGLDKERRSDTPVTIRSLENLRAFLDATGWGCMYGLNRGRGSVEVAAEEAAYAYKILGPRLIALQLGNEPDSWKNRYRGADWTYGDYWKEWIVTRKAVLERVPGAKFAGPDISNKLGYVTGFAADVKKSAPEVTMLTSHYYTMGPAGKPGMTIDAMLAPDTKLDRTMKIIMEAARGAGLPYRMCEGNSCWNGGQQGASDVHASALWCVDTMLHLAALGSVGVNLHGGGEGVYAPIVGGPKQFTRRPVFYGMQMVRPFFGATLVESTLACASDRVRAYVAEKNGALMVALVNKTDAPVAVQTPLRHARRQWTLSGPSLDARQQTTLTESKPSVLHRGVLHVEPHAAVLLEA